MERLMRRILVPLGFAAGLLVIGAFAPGSIGTPSISETSFRVSTVADPETPGAFLTQPVPGRGDFVGVTWGDGEPDKVEIRAFVNGSWTAWQELISDDEDSPDVGTSEYARQRRGASPVTFSNPTSVQVRITGDVPDRLEISFIDIVASQRTLAAGRAVAGLTIQPRSAWDPGNACAPRQEPEEIQAEIVFIHHTGIDNDYRQSRVPDILLGYCLYHRNGRGWDDIAYNFLIDRFGTIWEGRAGGIEKGIRGGHTKGMNNYSIGVALIGNYIGEAPSGVQLKALTDLLTWKMGIHNIDPLGKVDLVTEGSRKFAEGERVRFNRIAGHLDAQLTACPGRYLYNLLPQIRDTVAGSFRAAAIETYGPVVPGDFTGDGVKDGAAFQPDSGTWFVTSGETGDQITWTTNPTSDEYTDAVAADLNGDGFTDVVAVANGKVVELTSNGSGFSAATVPVNGTPLEVLRVSDGSGEQTLVADTNGTIRIGPSFATLGSVPNPVDVAAGDLDGDGIDEVVVVDTSGRLHVLAQDGSSPLHGAQLALGTPDRVVVAAFGDSGNESIAAVDTSSGVVFHVTASGSSLKKAGTIDLETRDYIGDVFAATDSGGTRLIALDAYVGEWKAVTFDGRRSYYTLLEDQPYRTTVVRDADVSTRTFLSWYGQEFKWLRSTFGYGQDDDTNAATPVVGSSRYTTNTAMTQMAYDRAENVVLATSNQFPDALAAGAVAAKLDGALLLSDPSALPALIAAEIKRLGASVVTIAGGPAAIGADVEQSLVALGVDVRRIGGANRYETATKLSQAYFNSDVDTVYIATGLNYPDALAGVPAAALDGSPILLVSDSVPASVKRELQRLEPSKIVVLGGPVAVSDNVVEALEAIAGVPVVRLGGANRYGTAVKVSQYAFEGPVDTVFLASGTDFIDALIAGPVAHRLGGPVLLTGSSLSRSVYNEIKRLRPDRIVVVGSGGSHDILVGLDGIGPSVTTEVIGYLPRP